MKSDVPLVIILFAVAVLSMYSVFYYLPAQAKQTCDPPPWPEGWPEPHTTVQHTTGWVCQYGESLPGERYGWTVCMRWTQAQGCEIFEGVNVRGDRL